MPASAIVYANDLRRMSEFYARCFSLTAQHSTQGHCVLVSPTWSLTLVRSEEARPSSVPAPLRTTTPVKLAFDVAAIEDTLLLAAELGGAKSKSGVWTFEGSRRYDCADPEGNLIQLVEHDS